jgi:hypothetical protein
VLTVTYTDSLGNPNLTHTMNIGGSQATFGAGALIPIVPTNGNRISIIQKVSLAISTGTAGNFGITAVRHLCAMHPPSGNTGCEFDWSKLGLPRVHDSACLGIISWGSGFGAGILYGTIRLVQA